MIVAANLTTFADYLVPRLLLIAGVGLVLMVGVIWGVVAIVSALVA